jgi:hypothetical protein
MMENDSVRFIVVQDQDAASGQLGRRHDGQRARRLFGEVCGAPEGTAMPWLTDDADAAAHLLGELL